MQHLAVELLIFADGLKEARGDLDAFKRALVAAGADASRLFSAESQAEAWDGDPVDDEGVDFDYSEVQWQEDASATEWERLQAAMARDLVTVQGEDSTEGLPTSLMPDVIDREWT